jgi:hypothetical protein
MHQRRKTNRTPALYRRHCAVIVQDVLALGSETRINERCTELQVRSPHSRICDVATTVPVLQEASSTPAVKLSADEVALATDAEAVKRARKTAAARGGFVADSTTEDGASESSLTTSGDTCTSLLLDSFNGGWLLQKHEALRRASDTAAHTWIK